MFLSIHHSHRGLFILYTDFSIELQNYRIKREGGRERRKDMHAYMHAD